MKLSQMSQAVSRPRVQKIKLVTNEKFFAGRTSLTATATDTPFTFSLSSVALLKLHRVSSSLPTLLFYHKIWYGTKYVNFDSKWSPIL